MMMPQRISLAHVLLSGLLAACGEAQSPPAPGAPVSVDRLVPEPPPVPTPVADPTSPPGPAVPPVPPAPAEPAEPPDIASLKIRVTEEGIFGPGIMITADGIIAPGVSITKDGLRVLDDDNGTAMLLTRERLKQLGRELKDKLSGKDVRVHEGRIELGGLAIPVGDIDIDIVELVLETLGDGDSDRDGAAATNQSCAAGDCTMSCAPGETCKATCAGGDCHQVCRDKATCHFTCAGGECNQRCEGTATCRFTCAGGGCSRACAKTATCSASCSGDGCSDAH